MPFLPDQSAFALHADSEYRHDLTLIALGWHVSADHKNFPALFAAFSPKGPSHGASMKKPRPAADEPQPRKIIRADKAPTTGYSLVVDGHFKSHHDTVEAAEEAGMALKNRFQMLQVQVYDAENKTRSMIDWPGPA
jgi:hypothetical protein